MIIEFSFEWPPIPIGSYFNILFTFSLVCSVQYSACVENSNYFGDYLKAFFPNFNIRKSFFPPPIPLPPSPPPFHFLLCGPALLPLFSGLTYRLVPCLKPHLGGNFSHKIYPMKSLIWLDEMRSHDQTYWFDWISESHMIKFTDLIGSTEVTWSSSFNQMHFTHSCLWYHKEL